MGRDYGTFVKDIKSENTAKIAKSLSYIGTRDYSDVHPSMIDDVIINLNPKSPKDITTSLYIMSLYASYIGNTEMLYMVRSANRKSLWKMAKPNAPKKFISYDEFQKIYDNILRNEEHNALYQATIFACIYHGIYSDDLSVLKNLRSSDINDDKILLTRDDGTRYYVAVPTELSNNLKQLSEYNSWWRNNRYGAYEITINGIYKDSCFKAENRNGTSEYAYRYSYYRILRNISKEYAGRSITPLQIYVSGIMNRISNKLASVDINLEDAFADNNKDKTVSNIIKLELSASGYDIEVRNFREIVKGHIDSFV